MTAVQGRSVRVLVVDDSATARGLIRGLIEDAQGLEVCGEAWNGRDAVRQVKDLRPDIVTMDLEMPVMNGMDAISEIMAAQASRILVLSDIADAAHAMAAIARGALDAAAKPSLDDGAAFAARLRMLSGVPVIRHLRAHVTGEPADVAVVSSTLPRAGLARGDTLGEPLIAIACSTGGPQALAQLLPALPAGLPCAVVIAQHISDGFAAGMAHWLDDLCALRVSVARHGEYLLPGHVYLADSASHLAITARRMVQLQPRGEQDVYRPSCDRLLCSVAAAAGADAIGVILTGMGRDGASGMAEIAAAGGRRSPRTRPARWCSA